MCGITGAVWTDPRLAVDRAQLEQMTDRLVHRGPDDRGFYTARVPSPQAPEGIVNVALGMRRLAIIDVAGGHQPIANEDESVWIVFNGEIFNHGELRRRLEGRGHRFRTHCDTETIVHLYEDLGPQCLELLNGMFALAIWDAGRKQLLLARDRLGKKPLVYRNEPGRLLFASELKSLLQAPHVPRQLDPQALDEYLAYQYVPHPHTIYRGIAKLPPGHYGIYREGEWNVTRYWSPDLNSEVDRPHNQNVQELRELMTDAVRVRLESEVPLGAFLSGGVDSSIVVGLMQKLSSTPVKTFSIGFDIPEFDETSYAWQVARQLGTDHHTFRVDPDALAILPKLAYYYDEPFADSSAIPTWFVSQFTRQHVTVALTGDGGDELFAGYPRYRAVDIAGRIDHLPALGSAMARVATSRWMVRSGSQRSWLRRARRLAEGLGQSPDARYFDWMSIFSLARRGALYSDALLEQLPNADPFAYLDAVLSRCRQRDRVTAASLADLFTYLPCDLMTKVDTASMAHSLECRCPFLDYRLVEWAIRLPLAEKYRRLRGKRILLEALGDLLPAAIRRRGKMGFGVPLAAWFRGRLRQPVEELLMDGRTTERGYFRPEAVAQLWREHQSGGWDHSARLWSLVMLESWQRAWLD